MERDGFQNAYIDSFRARRSMSTVDEDEGKRQKAVARDYVKHTLLRYASSVTL
jgi:hypothetical protein